MSCKIKRRRLYITFVSLSFELWFKKGELQ
jgi:hypothetical protein